MEFTNAGLLALTATEEQQEIRMVGTMPPKALRIGFKAIELKRTFDMTLDGEKTRFWRVMTPGHPNCGSDLSVAGLKQWGII